MSDNKAVDDLHAISGQKVDLNRNEQEEQQTAKEFSSNTRFSMHVKVYSPFRDYYNKQAFSISAINATGPFDILPKHHNFICLLEKGDLLIWSTDQSIQKISITNGLMHVKSDKVVVFLDV